MAQLFYCEFCEILKNTFFVEHLQVTASKAQYEIIQVQRYSQALVIFVLVSEGLTWQ